MGIDTCIVFRLSQLSQDMSDMFGFADYVCSQNIVKTRVIEDKFHHDFSTGSSIHPYFAMLAGLPVHVQFDRDSKTALSGVVSNPLDLIEAMMDGEVTCDEKHVTDVEPPAPLTAHVYRVPVDLVDMIEANPVEVRPRGLRYESVSESPYFSVPNELYGESLNFVHVSGNQFVFELCARSLGILDSSLVGKMGDLLSTVVSDRRVECDDTLSLVCILCGLARESRFSIPFNEVPFKNKLVWYNNLPKDHYHVASRYECSCTKFTHSQRVERKLFGKVCSFCVGCNTYCCRTGSILCPRCLSTAKTVLRECKGCEQCRLFTDLSYLKNKMMTDEWKKMMVEDSFRSFREMVFDNGKEVVKVKTFNGIYRV